MDAIIAKHAAKLKVIYDDRTAGDHTFTGVLAEFLLECEQSKSGFVDRYTEDAAKRTSPMANVRMSTMCACGDYFATSQTDLDEHVMSMMHVEDGKNHG